MRLATGRRLWIAMVSIFLRYFQVSQFFLFAISFMGAAFVRLEYEPYFLPCLNTLEVCLSAVTCALLLFGMVFYTGRLSDGQELLLTILVIGLLVFVFAVIGYYMYLELGIIRVARSGRRSVLRVRERQFWKYVQKDLQDWEDQDLARTLQAYGSGQRPTEAVFENFGCDLYQEGLSMTLEEVDQLNS